MANKNPDAEKKLQKLQIIAMLRQNGRVSLTEMSEKTGLSVSYLHSFLKKLKGNEVIKFFCEPDYTAISYSIMVCFLAKSNEKKLFVDKIWGNKNVNDILKVNNGNDFIIEAFFRNMNEVYEFSEMLKENSAEITEHHIVKILAKEKMLRN